MCYRTVMSAALICFLSLSLFAASQTGGTISGTVKDPAGALVAGARITARNEATGEVRTVITDDGGRYKIDNVAAGRYTIAVSREGFNPAERSVEVTVGRVAIVEIKLEVAGVRSEITIGGKGAVAPNSEPHYRALRDGVVFETYQVSNLTLKRDVGTFALHSGRISFLAPVMDRVVKAVFSGEGEFSLTPVTKLERDYMRSITESETLSENFGKAAFCFTDDTYKEIKRQAQATEGAAGATELIRDFEKRARNRSEDARSLVEYLLADKNLEAEVLADLYNPKREGFFSAYIFGRKYNDLRFSLKPLGALPQILSPEEVSLVSLDPLGEKDGILYLSHQESEFKSGGASSEEDHRIIDAEHYRIETVIDGGDKLTASAELTFKALSDGDRVLSFGLLPSLRVARATVAGREVHFIQEQRKQDGSFYVVLPEPMVTGQEYKVAIEYQGNKVVEDAGGGNFAVGARTSWYPSVNAFNDRATFDLTFKVPRQYTLVGVGTLANESQEGNFAVTQWTSAVPLAVAGFNYGLFKKKEITDADTKYKIEGYATAELPGYIRNFRMMTGNTAGESITPSRLTDNAIVDAQNSMRIFTRWFGEAPYGRIAITQQPEANFGQSWPTLVYLPLISFLDSTQRYMLLQRISSGMTDFIEEVGPHEVSHQWWGHIVGWASFHDQWLSEGFADFSAGLFLQATEKKPDKYLHYWERGRERILEKNRYNRRANDAGPIWMGLRLSTFKNPGAYNRLVYPKGGYVLHMLRWMMHDRKTGDERFIAMMHDFVKTYFNQNASTEGFKAVVEKHMTPVMDLDGNRRMDWFFKDWVFGTDVPSYKLEYSLTPESGGKVLLAGVLTQSGVSPSFKMLVPIYLDFDGNIQRLGQVNVTGNASTQEFKVRLPQRPKRVFLNANYDVLAVESLSAEKK
ncbi:MAG TPA: carboxypeptidase regulatory-like domain-containing protein [Blastocatellia bacterium]|nr:carboxypeptidase regulatory-like domain-containing protein [Blastocatellia bacterium]